MRASSPFLQAPLQEESGNAMRIATRTWSMLLMKCAVYVLLLFSSRPDISQDESSMAASFVLFLSNYISIG